MIGQPNFTTVGTGQGFSVGWSELLPQWPTLSVNYKQGSGNGTIYATNQETGSNTQTINAHSTYLLGGFRLIGYYDHTKYDAVFPVFLIAVQGTDSRIPVTMILDSAEHDLPWHGAFFASYNYTEVKSDFASTIGQNANNSSYYNQLRDRLCQFPCTLKVGCSLTRVISATCRAILSGPDQYRERSAACRSGNGIALDDGRRRCELSIQEGLVGRGTGRTITIKRIRGPMSAVL